MTNYPEIKYFSTEGDETYPMTLVIPGSGPATLTVGTNRLNLNETNCGKFKTLLSSQNIDPLIAVLRNPGFASIQNPDSVLPGEVIRKISLNEDQHHGISKFVTPYHTPAPEFNTAESILKNIVNHVKQFPKFVLSLNRFSFPTVITNRDPVEFVLVLTNPGNEKLFIQHPKLWSDVTSQVELIALRNDISTANLRTHHQKFEILKATHLTNIQIRHDSVDLMELNPQSMLTLEFKINLNWPVGQYNVQVSVQTPIIDCNKNEIHRVEILSKPVSITVYGSQNLDDTTIPELEL